MKNRWYNFTEILIGAGKECCGIANLTNIRTKKTAWWNEDIKLAVKKKIAWVKCMCPKQRMDYEYYREKSIIMKKAVKEAKKERWIKIGHAMKESFAHTQKLFYGTVQELRQRRTVRMLTIKDWLRASRMRR